MITYELPTTDPLTCEQEDDYMLMIVDGYFPWYTCATEKGEALVVFTSTDAIDDFFGVDGNKLPNFSSIPAEIQHRTFNQVLIECKSMKCVGIMLDGELIPS